MGLLTRFEYDAFVSYAHSGLDAWSKGFVDDLKGMVAGGLDPKAPGILDFWIDTRTEGNMSLNDNLEHKIEHSACIIILMTERFLESDWCTREINWFNKTIARKVNELSQPVFVVRLHDIKHDQWPESLRALPGYNFVDDKYPELKLPKGFSAQGEKPRGDDYQQACRPIARDMIRHIRLLQQVENEKKRTEDEKGGKIVRPEPPIPPIKRRLYLAAVPEDSLKLRRDLAAFLSPHFEIVPGENPRDPKTIKDQAANWIGRCELCAAVLGASSGIWNEDDDGFVLYQQRLIAEARKQTFNYRSPRLGDVADLEPAPYREFMEHQQRAPNLDLAEFARGIIEVQAADPKGRDKPVTASVYLVADGDRALEDEVRALLGRFQVPTYPLSRAAHTSRDLADLSREEELKDLIKASNAVLLLNGEGKAVDRTAIDRKVFTISTRYAPELVRQRAIAIVDGPPDPRLEDAPPFLLFKKEARDFSDQVRDWLAKVAPSGNAVS